MSEPSESHDLNTFQGESDWELADDASLFQYFHPRLVRFTSKLLAGTGLDPEDVAQEAIWKVISKRAFYDPQYRFTTWVYIIARRTAMDHRRRRRPILAGESLDNIATGKHNHVTAVETRDQVERIWEIAERVLSSDQHAALWLRYGEEMGVSEVASVLRKPTVTTRVLLYRARAILRRHLEDAGNTPDGVSEVEK
ncbi:RNA polymerase sigma factor [Planctomycetaceae bacterium SH139]